jgi:hypothetical protein
MQTTINSFALGTQTLTGRRNRDRELIGFIARHGVVEIAHVMAAMGVGKTAAYRRVAACIEAGLLERLALLRAEPTLLRATREGLRYVGLAALPLALVSPGAADHFLRCTATALALITEFDSESVIGERELALLERIEQRPLASARLVAHGREGLHRPDLAVFTPDATIAIEVELSAKAPRRLEAIVRAWRRATWIEEVRYYCAPGATRRGLERAIEKTRAEQKVHLFEAPPRARSEQASLRTPAERASQSDSFASGAGEKPNVSGPSRRERSASRCSE